MRCNYCDKDMDMQTFSKNVPEKTFNSEFKCKQCNTTMTFITKMGPNVTLEEYERRKQQKFGR